MSDLLLNSFETPKNDKIPQLRPGDSATVYVKINVGMKNERTQMVRGMILRKGGAGNNETFTLRRIAPGAIGVEITYLVRSPLIQRIEIQRHAYVRRAKLYYMRDLRGKAARLRERRIAR